MHMRWVLLYFVAVATVCLGDHQTISTTSTFRSCGNRKMNSSAILQTLSVINEIDCARACKNDKRCRSSNFVRDNTEHQCQLLSTSIDDISSCSDLLPDSTSQAIGMVSHVRSYPTCSYDVMRTSCHFEQPMNETCQCVCADGFRGEFCEEPPRDCSDFNHPTGLKDIYLPETDAKWRVNCAGISMYILRFCAANNAFERYRNLTWDDFKTGFNTYYLHPFWFGAEIIHNITTKLNYNYSLVVHVIKDPRPPHFWVTTIYDNVYLGDESTNYTIHFTDATLKHSKGSAMLFDNTQFRTMDYNSNSCTNTHRSSWWYPESCTFPSPLSGYYLFNGTVQEYGRLYFSLKRI